MEQEISQKVEQILADLDERYKLGEAFTAKVRPLVEKILDPEMPEEAREPLMDELIDVYESQARLRNNLEMLHEYVHRAFHNKLSQGTAANGSGSKKE